MSQQKLSVCLSDTHPTPLHARGGRYTRRSGGESAIATAARSLHLSTRGFAARQARQPAPGQLQPAGQLQRRGERLVYPESKRAAGWVENRAKVISMRVRMKGVIGAGVSGSKGERPGTMNVQRVAAAVSRKIKIYLLRIGHERDGGERNDRNGERKDREIPRGRKNGGRAWWSREAARARSQHHAHSRRQQARSPRGPGTLNLLLMQKKNRMSDSLLLWE